MTITPPPTPQSPALLAQSILIEVNGQPVSPTWEAKTEVDACNCQGKVNSPTSVSFTWETS